MIINKKYLFLAIICQLLALGGQLSRVLKMRILAKFILNENISKLLFKLFSQYLVTSLGHQASP